MQDADHGQFVRTGDEINDVRILESRAQSFGERLTRRANSGMATELFHLIVNPFELPRGGCFRGLEGQICPDFGEVSFGGVG